MNFVLTFVLLFLFTSLVQAQQQAPLGLFVSVIQDPPVLCSRQDIHELIEFSKHKKIKILFVQVYRSNEAWFSSRVAGTKVYKSCLEESLSNPLQELIKEAHRAKIEVHAWLNLLSLGNNQDAVMIKKYGKEILTRNLKRKERIEDYKIDEQYFLEPSDQRVQADLLEIVDELLRTYPQLDGIQFDYIRYPDLHPAYGYSPDNIQRFKKRTGQGIVTEKDPIWQQWKRDQVTRLLEKLTYKARRLRPGIKVSTTGCLPFTRAYMEAFQDWPKWVNTGLVDFVTLMNYPIKSQEFERNIEEAKIRVSQFSRINMAIGAYKFLNAPESFKEELEICQTKSSGACVIFHYGNLITAPKLQEKF